MADYQEEIAELLPENTTLPRQGIGINVERLFKLRGRTMLLYFLVPAIVAPLLILLLIPKEFEAEATLLFRSQVPSITTDERPLSGETYVTYVKTQVDIIKSYEILRRALQDPRVQELPEIAGQEEPILYMMGHIEAGYDRETEIVRATFRHPDRDTAVTTLTSIIDAYMKYVDEQEEDAGKISRDILNKNQQDLDQVLTELQNDIAAKRRESGLPVGEIPGLEPTETESLRIALTQAQNDLVRAQNTRRQVEQRIELAQEYMRRHEQNPGQAIYAMGVEQTILLDPSVALLLEQLAQVQQEYSAIADRYVEGRPELTAMQSELEALQGRVDQAKAGARTTALQSLLAQYEYDLTVEDANIADAQERVEQFESLLAANREENIELSQSQGEIEELINQYNDTREYRRSIQDQLLTLAIEQDAPARASVLGEATAPSEPDNTRRLKFILVALLASVMLGMTKGVVDELRDQTIRSAQDIAYITELPVLAAVPHISEDRLPPTAAPATVTDDFPSSMTADEYRRAVSKIIYAQSGAGAIRSCLIASPARGDGKSTLACNVAIVLAQAERRVLLVDLDSRNPAVEKNFGLKPAEGLAEMLSGQQLAHDPDRQTSFENLYVLGPGMRSKDLLERLSSRDMADFLSGAEELFDIVILDTPAALLMSEARIVAPMVDGVVVVVGSGISSFGMLRRCLNVLSDSGGRVLGIVLNTLRQSPGGYLRRNLDQYYDQGVGRKENSPAAAKPRRTAEASIILLDEDEGPKKRQ